MKTVISEAVGQSVLQAEEFADAKQSKNALKWEHISTNLVRYRKTGMYYVKAKIHGKKVKESLGTDKLDSARKLLSAWLTRVQGSSSRGKTGTTVGAVIELWEGWLENKIQAKRTTSTRLENRDVILKTWPTLERTKVGRLTKYDIEVWRDSMVSKHQYSNSQANLCLGTLRQILRIADEHGMLLHVNPATLVKQLRPTKRKIQLPSKEDFERIKALIYKRAKRAGIVFEFLSLTGMRIRSSHEVNWGDVDEKANKLHVRHAKHGEYTIPLFKPLKDFLLKIRPADWTEADRITATDDINTVIKKACETLKLPRMSHHSLRHWAATHWIENNVDIPTVSRWLGHKDGGALAMSTYGHLRDEHSQDMAALVT